MSYAVSGTGERNGDDGRDFVWLDSVQNVGEDSRRDSCSAGGVESETVRDTTTPNAISTPRHGERFCK